jgi:protein-S-isoprenylcysteine O-methyltransferase Ste14
MNLELTIPPLALTLLIGIAMVVGSWFLPDLDYSSAISISIGSLTMIIAAYFCVYGVVEFSRNKTTVDPRFPEKSSSLVTSGVYSVSRNPMYLGFSLFLFSLVVFLRSPYLLCAVAAFVIYMNRFQVLPEERILELHFGDAFLTYKSKVRRWI